MSHSRFFSLISQDGSPVTAYAGMQVHFYPGDQTFCFLHSSEINPQNRIFFEEMGSRDDKCVLYGPGANVQAVMQVISALTGLGFTQIRYDELLIVYQLVGRI